MLLDCPECAGKVSDRAESCPHCGCPISDASAFRAKPQANAEAPIPSREEPIAASPDEPPPIPASVAATSKPQSRWRTAPHAPWSRWAARTLDTFAVGFPFGMLLLFVVAAVGGPQFANALSTSPLINNEIVLGIVLLFACVPIFAALISWTGTTPGKWLFGLRVRSKSGQKLTLASALGREVYVVAAGNGLGIPIVALVCSLVQYSKLKKCEPASWDEDGTEVLYLNHTPATQLRAALGVFLLISATAALTLLGKVNG